MYLLQLALVAATLAKDPLTPKFSRRLSPFEREGEECTNKCSPDCSSMILCNGDAAPIVVNCRNLTNGQRPYCNSDSISCDTTSDKCEPATSDTCSLRDGFYPNLIDCKR